LSVGVASAGVAAVVAAGWGVQRIAFPAPERAERVAVSAEAWFHYYRLSFDVFHAEDQRFSGECIRGWSVHPPVQPRPQHVGGLVTIWPGSVLAFSGGPVVLAKDKHAVHHVYGTRRRDLPGFLAVAIGCTGALANALTQAVQSNRDLSIERAYAANHPALALELRLHHERLTLYLSPRTYRPLVVVGAVGGQIATARVYLTRFTPAREAQLRNLLRRHGFPPQTAVRGNSQRARI